MSTLDEFYQSDLHALPPICLRTHWDPTAVAKHVLPTTAPTQLPLDPRQATKICYGYYHTSFGDPKTKENKNDPSPTIPPALLGGAWQSPQSTPSPVFPPGGAASLGFPYKDFSSKTESDLQLLQYPMTKCSERKYLPPNRQAPVSMSTNIVPGSNNDALSPLATAVVKQAGCRNHDDSEAWNRSARLFYNPTKYDRTQNVPAGLKIPESNKTLRC
jgi:hypothetical protein